MSKCAAASTWLIASAKQSEHLWLVRAVWTNALVSWFDLGWLLEWYTQSFGAHGWSTFFTYRIPTHHTTMQSALSVDVKRSSTEWLININAIFEL